MFFKFFGRKDSSKPQQTTSETPSTDSQTNDNANTIDSPRIDPEEEARQEQETLDRGLGKTKTGFLGRIKRAIAGRSRVDEDFLDELEEIFITSDIGTETSLQIIEALEKRVAQDKYINTSELYDILYDEIMNLLADSASARPDSSNLGTHPYVIMVVGVNGVGKTTTIGKLAYQYKRAGNKVILGAADTFRAAAIEQLEEWGRRAGVPVIKQQLGSDPAAVA